MEKTAVIGGDVFNDSTVNNSLDDPLFDWGEYWRNRCLSIDGLAEMVGMGALEDCFLDRFIDSFCE